MGYAVETFRWVSIAPNATVGLFIHPYTEREFVAFSINVAKRSNQPGGAYRAIAAQQTDGPTHQHVDGLARTVHVTNLTQGPQAYISVGLMQFRQQV